MEVLAVAHRSYVKSRRADRRLVGQFLGVVTGSESDVVYRAGAHASKTDPRPLQHLHVSATSRRIGPVTPAIAFPVDQLIAHLPAEKLSGRLGP